MPKANNALYRGAQMITFAVHHSGGGGYTWIRAKKGTNCARIAANAGRPDLAATIAALNHVGVHYHFKRARRIKLPKAVQTGPSFDVMADDAAPPTITTGYPKLAVVTRPGMIGIAQFQGYDPTAMDVPIRFEATEKADGSGVEQDIATLELMAGRGNFAGAGVGPPPILQLSTTDNNGNVVPLIPLNYQWNARNPGAPLWRIANLSWDAKPWRNKLGRRIRQTAVVTVWEYTPLSLQVSLAQRTKGKTALNSGVGSAGSAILGGFR